MRLCSFDVGIKNLAICIINKKEKTFEIEKWEIINIIDSDKKCYLDKCSNIGKFIVGGKSYCNKHKDQKPEKFFQEVKNKICSKCGKKACLMKDELIFCKVHGKQYLNNLYKPIKINCYKQDLQTLCTSLFKKLDDLNIVADEVVIENQPSLKNPAIKTVSVFLYSYFIFNKEKLKISTIKFISPLNKLKFNKKRSDELLSQCKTKTEKYKLTKKLGEEYTFQLISEDEKKLIEKATKKDDLCDAFLQGYHYLFLT